MSERKSYGQFCGLARSLDRVGDRWTLLVVRELLLGERTFRDLQTALDGISPTVLTQRLTELASDALVVRSEAPQRSKSVTYSLSEDGRALEPVIIELIRWGSRWMLQGPGDDRTDPRWAPLALRALLAGRPSRPGRIHLDVEGVEVTVVGSSRQRRVTAGLEGSADATIAAPLPVLLAIAAGATTLQAAGVEVLGDTGIADDLLLGAGPRS